MFATKISFGASKEVGMIRCLNHQSLKMMIRGGDNSTIKSGTLHRVIEASKLNQRRLYQHQHHGAVEGFVKHEEKKNMFNYLFILLAGSPTLFSIGYIYRESLNDGKFVSTRGNVVMCDNEKTLNVKQQIQQKQASSSSVPKKDTVHVDWESRGTETDFYRHYDCLKVLGKGTFSVVRQCREKETKQLVAVKEINRKESDDTILRQEVNIMHKLSAMKNGKANKNIIQMHNVYEGKKSLFMVVELASGGELFDRIIDKGEMSERIAARFLRDLAEGIKAIHEERIVHLDIKPENLLLTSKDDNADIKIADFGLACYLPDDSHKLNQCVGTPAYWAPEMILHENFSFPVDIWALGCVLYILLMGIHPFDPNGDATEAHILAMVAQANYDKTNPQWKMISRSAKDLISHLLDPDPKRRYTAEQVLNHPWVRFADTQSDQPLPNRLIDNLRVFKLLRFVRQGFLGRATGDRDLFSCFDTDKDGKMTLKEFTDVLRKLGIDISDPDVQSAFDHIDKNKDGVISRDEFYAVIDAKVNHESTLATNQRTSLADIEVLFGLFDRNSDGYITKEDFHHVLELIGTTATESVIASEMRIADQGGDGKVDFAEFERYIRIVEDRKSDSTGDTMQSSRAISSVHTMRGRTASRSTVPQ